MAKKSRRGRDLRDWHSNRRDAGIGKLRIIGGDYKGRLIEYSGDPVTRPMKDNTREAVFNLVGGWVKDKVVFDLFAGTGAIGLEALSRGAEHVILIERHFPTVKIIQRNIESLGEQVTQQTEVAASDTFFWVRQFAKQPSFVESPWLVFCSPPYDLFVQREDEIMEMLDSLIQLAPEQSIFVVESDNRFDVTHLPHLAKNSDGQEWEIRFYAPAQVAVLKL